MGGDAARSASGTTPPKQALLRKEWFQVKKKYATLFLTVALVLMLTACGDGAYTSRDSEEKNSSQDLASSLDEQPDVQNEPDKLKIPQGGDGSMIARGSAVCFGILPDGSVVMASEKNQKELPVWNDVLAMDADSDELAVVHADGTVTKHNILSGETQELDWTGVVDVAFGTGIGPIGLVALRGDGTVICDSTYPETTYYGRIAQELGSWSGITAIAVGARSVIGLKSDGTVVATAIQESNEDKGQTAVGEWTDIVAIAAGAAHTVGLKSDGTVVACGSDSGGKLEVEDWSDIVMIAAGINHTVGLRADGTVLVAGDVYDEAHGVTTWEDVVAVACNADERYTTALFADGTVKDEEGSVNPEDWPALRSPKWYH